MNTEALRHSYKPKNMKLLLIGESAPASGHFFYEHSRMTTYVLKAFERIFNKSFEDDRAFLKYFKDKGCYLDDLSLIPVNNLSTSERNKILKESIVCLSERIKNYNPKVIAIVLKKIDRYAKKAIALANISCPVCTLPFPGNSHQVKFINEFSKELSSYIK